MTAAIARFELGQQLRGHVFWVVVAISLLMAAGSVAVDDLRVGVSAAGLRNGPEAVVETHLVWTLFFMFTTAAFVADAVLRDEISGFAPIIAAAPVPARALVLGRFAGAFAAVLLCFGSVPLAIVAGAHLPWIDPATVGPAPTSALLFAFVVMAAPNLLLSATLGFALATLTRSMTAALVGAILLLVAYGLGARSGAALPAVLEPFGFAAWADALRELPEASRNHVLPPVADTLLLNRLLSLAISAALLGTAVFGFDPRRPARENGPAPSPAGPPQALVRPDMTRAFGPTARLAQCAARFRLEWGQAIWTPVCAGLLLLGLANAVAALRASGAAPDDAVRALSQAFQLAPTVIALFFAGELRWSEKERGLDGIVGACPAPDAVLVLPKLLAVVALLAALGMCGVGAALLLACARGDPFPAHLADWLLSALYDWTLVAVLAFFLQALAPNKLAGWGYLVLFLIASLTFEKLGWTDPLYRYGRYPGWPLPAPVSGAAHVGAFRAYWTVVAILLVIATLRLARRGRALGRA